MRKMKIYEQAMCCSTGLCGVGVDPELLRISTVINNLEKIGVKVERYNLSNAPQEFVNNKLVNDFIIKEGAEKLPLIIIDNEIAMYGRYPTNLEIGKLIEIDVTKFTTNKVKINNKNKDCGAGGCC